MHRAARHAVARVRLRCLTGCLASLATGSTVPCASAQGYTPTRALVDSIAATVASRYVNAAKGEVAARALLRNYRAGRYGDLASADVLADVVSRDLRSLLDGDRHFAVLPPRQALQRAGTTLGADTSSRLRVMSRGAPSAAAVGPDGARVSRVEREDAERRVGHYFRAIERRPGNVLVIDFEQFALPTEQARAVASAVMQLAATADAVIIDLRLNRGGAEGLNRFIASHFFPADSSLVLYSRYQRRGDLEQATRVLPDLMAPRMPSTPLFLVTDGGTASAAENLAYTLQQHKRATVVGERSMGAANSSETFAMPDGFALQVPTARVVHPRTGTNWEGTGVLPDHVVPAYAALDSAYGLALSALGSDSTRRLTGERAEVSKAQRRHAVMSEAPSDESLTRLRAFAGRYGSSEVRLAGTVLVIQAYGTDGSPGATLRLRELGGDRFEIEGYPDTDRMPVQFLRDAVGGVIALRRYSGQAGDWVELERARNEARPPRP